MADDERLRLADDVPPAMHVEGADVDDADEEEEDAVTMSGRSSSSSSSASSYGLCATNNGHDAVSARIRSVLMHPLGLPLWSCFHDGGGINGDGSSSSSAGQLDRESLARIQRFFPHQHWDRRSVAFNDAFADSYKELKRVGEVYREWAKERQGVEPANEGSLGRTNTARKPTEPNKEVLTRTFCDKISPALESEGFEVIHRHRVKDYYDGTFTRSDVLIRLKGDPSVVMAMNVGLGVESGPKCLSWHWWATAGRSVWYLGSLLEERNCDDSFGVTVSGPSLLAVVQVFTPRTVIEDATFKVGQLGVFLCAPSGGDSSKLRISLLHRDVFETLAGLSEAIGRAVRAAVAMVDMEEEGVGDDVQALGHNSCRVGDMVLRAYDSRYRFLDERPDLYEEPELAPGTYLVCRVNDRNLGALVPVPDTVDGCGTDEGQSAEATQSASVATPSSLSTLTRPGAAPPLLDLRLRDRRPHPGYFDRHQWLWELAGEFLVLATPYVEGRHYAQSPKDFIPVVRHLQRMNRLGCVHGDIRCANVVFGKGLIDLDLGGRVKDGPRYPPGYRSCLGDGDGSRLGQPGELIAVRDDWYALLDVIFCMHRILPPQITLEERVRRRQAEEPFRDYMYGTALDDVEGEMPGAWVDELVAYLERSEADGCTLRYSNHLERLYVKRDKERERAEPAPPCPGGRASGVGGDSKHVDT